jgi:hypothetical protein
MGLIWMFGFFFFFFAWREGDARIGVVAFRFPPGLGMEGWFGGSVVQFLRKSDGNFWFGRTLFRFVAFTGYFSLFLVTGEVA